MSHMAYLLRSRARSMNALRTIAVALFVTLIMAPGATAQFGSQLKAGDYGHVPVTTGVSVPLKIQYVGLGNTADGVRDACALIDVTTVTTGNPPVLNADSGASNKDLRLTPCMGKASGTEISDVDTIERTNAAYVATVTKYADVNHNGKYDKGDYLYVTTAPGGADRTLVTSTGPGQFTIRLLAAGDKAAGTWVFNGDDDMTRFGTNAAAFTASVVERDDKMRFVVNHASNTAPFDAKGALILENSIRINLVAPFQPAFKVTKLDLGSTTIAAGDTFTAKAEVQNTGKAPGVGVITSKVNGVIVDAVATPFLSPGEKATFSIKGFAPRTGTFAGFEVGEQAQRLTVAGGQPSVEDQIAVLLARVADLEGRVPPGPSASGAVASGDVIAAQGAGAAASSPGLDLTALLVAGLAGLVLVRRRA